jgi:hypothetical protein
LLAHGRWFSASLPTSPTTKTGRHDIAEILLKVALSNNHPLIQLQNNIMYNIPSSVSSQCCSYYCIYTILTPWQEPLTTPIIEEINIIVLALGLTKPGTWNRAHVLPRLKWIRWPLQRWGCLTNKCVYIVFLFVYQFWKLATPALLIFFLAIETSDQLTLCTAISLSMKLAYIYFKYSSLHVRNKALNF